MLTVNTFFNPNGTVGQIQAQGLECWTIERPWLNNEPGVSCVPAGVYQLEWHEPTSVSLPDGWTGTWAMVNESLGVSHFPTPGVARNVCLFGHIANYPEDVQGCVGFGDNHIIHDSRLMVTSSRATTTRVLEYIRDNNISEVEIVRAGFPG